MQDVWRLQDVAMSLMWRFQKVHSSKSLHSRVCRSQVHELRRGWLSQMLQLLIRFHIEM
jgi:hypothetical protein